MIVAGLWPIPLHPRGIDIGRDEPTEGKEPIGKAWGAKRNTPDKIRRFFMERPKAGVGVGLGPGRAPGEKWLVDVEGDGPEAEESRARLFGGEEIVTLGWGSVRGGHQLLIAVAERVAELLKPLKGLEGKGLKTGVYHLPGLPGLEIRFGGFKEDGSTVKQVQSAFPPTPGTDGKPREWNGVSTIAPAPESLYEALERAGAPVEQTGPTNGEHSKEKPFTATNGRPDAETRAIAYLATIGPSIQGQGGSNPCFKAACKIGPGFALSPETAFRILWTHYNVPGRCDPLWSEQELRHKVEDAYKSPGNPPHGWLLDAERNGNGGGKQYQANGPPEGVASEHEVAEEADDDVVDRWPKIDPLAFHGIAGEFVRAVDPHTESDPVAVLAQFLVMAGNLFGRSAYFPVGGDRHYLNEYVALVGPTSTGRKGSSWAAVRFAANHIDEGWLKTRVTGGMVSGEGLIHFVRDPMYKVVDVKEKGRVVGQETVMGDPGEADKRLMVVETEMGRPLKAMNRDTNTLSDVLRQAWDGGHLATMAKNSACRATGAHVSLVCHVTRADIEKHLLAADSLNGFGNRFLWLAVRRSKILPDGGDLEGTAFQDNWGLIESRLPGILEFARTCGRMSRDTDAARIWRGIYGQLSAGKPGTLGALLSRAEAHVTRLSCLYAVLDKSRTVQAKHLLAALALWDYAEASARFVFGDRLGDTESEKLLAALRGAPDGLSRTEISAEVFGGHKRRPQIVALLAELLTLGEIHRAPKEPGAGPGRKPEVWRAGRGVPGDAK
jgi:hypothetical protein